MVSIEKRKKYATVKVGDNYKFPIFSKKSAESAMKLMGHAKPPLTESQMATMRRKAAKFGVK